MRLVVPTGYDDKKYINNDNDDKQYTRHAFMLNKGKGLWQYLISVNFTVTGPNTLRRKLCFIRSTSVKYLQIKRMISQLGVENINV